MTKITRRTFAAGAGAALFANRSGFGLKAAWADMPATVKFGVLLPLTGAMAHSGHLSEIGFNFAVEDINSKGGIKSLGGAKLEAKIYDCGPTVETAANAAQRLLANEPDIVAGAGAWISSLTLAVTEVTERKKLPWITGSSSDTITGRGFEYIYAVTPAASLFASESIRMASEISKASIGRPMKTVGVIADSQLSAQVFLNALKGGILKDAGVELIVDETFASPLSDATSMVQRVRRAKPDLLIAFTGNVADSKLIFSKLKEFGLGGAKLPMLVIGTQNAAPEMLANVGADLLEGLMVVVAHWGTSKNTALTKSLEERSKEAWVGDDTYMCYASTQLLADALERAGSTDKEKVNAALKATNTDTGPDAYFPGPRLSFSPNGRIAGAPLIMVQWRDGKPRVVFPANLAAEKPVWRSE